MLYRSPPRPPTECDRVGNGVRDLGGDILLLCNVVHHVVDLIDVPGRDKERGLVGHVTRNSLRCPLHVIVGLLERIGRILHCLQDGRVCVGTLQRLPLHLDRGQGAIDLLQLLLVLLLPLQGSNSH